MYRTLAMKELRETSLVWGLAIGVTALTLTPIYMTSEWHNGGLIKVPMVGWLFRFGDMNRDFLFFDAYIAVLFIVISALLTIALGLYQTLSESARGTYPFLLHRPCPRWRILGMKLVVGAGLYLAIAGATIIATGIWSAIPGRRPSPFEWSMTANAWSIWISMPILYFGAFLTGFRPGRWFGSRLLPLISAAVIGLALVTTPLSFMLKTLIALSLIACFVLCIFNTANQRDFS